MHLPMVQTHTPCTFIPPCVASMHFSPPLSARPTVLFIILWLYYCYCAAVCWWNRTPSYSSFSVYAAQSRVGGLHTVKDNKRSKLLSPISIKNGFNVLSLMCMLFFFLILMHWLLCWKQTRSCARAYVCVRNSPSPTKEAQWWVGFKLTSRLFKERKRNSWCGCPSHPPTPTPVY